MISYIVITCTIIQTAVALYLLGLGKKKNDQFERHIYSFLVILLLHLCTKFFMLAVLNDRFLYGKVITGFGLGYGPLLYISARLFINKPLPRRAALFHLFPFLAFSLVYVILVTEVFEKMVSDTFIIHYTAYYQYLVAGSLLIYPLLVKRLLYKHTTGSGAIEVSRKKLLNNISSILLTGISLGVFFALTHLLEAPIPDFDLRVLPYLCFAVIPVVILKYKFIQVMGQVPAEASEIKRGPVLMIAEPAEERYQSSAPDNTEKFELKPVTAEKRYQSSAPDNGIKDNYAEAGLHNSDKPEKRYQKSALDARMMDNYELMLKKFMEKNKIYLTPELSLDQLARQVKVPRHHLTQLLNDRFNKNFYNFINEYRIREAVTRLSDFSGEDINLLSLAHDCGFNSKSSFNNYFKKITGQTPSAYRKKVAETALATTETVAS